MATKEERQALRRRRGYWVERARKRKGLTQQALAHDLGYNGASESVVSRWEKAERPIPSDRLEALARLLDLPPDYLVRPPLTDDERLDRAVNEAAKLEREDWDSGATPDPEGDDELDAGLGRRTA